MTLEEITKRYNESPKQWRGIKYNEVTIVLCPANMPKKWKREIESTINGSFVRIVEWAEDVHQFMDDFDEMLAKGERPQAYMVMTYERAKLGERIAAPAYQVYWGQKGFTREYDPETYNWQYKHQEYVMDPVTGGLLQAKIGKKSGNVTKTQMDKTKQTFFYEGRVFQHHLISEEPRTNEYGRVINEDDIILKKTPVYFNAVSDNPIFDEDKMYPLPMFCETRIYGLPKQGNGIVEIEWEEVIIPEKKEKIARYKQDRSTGKIVFKEWVDYTRREMTIHRAKAGKVLSPNRNTEDKWLAMQGVYCTQSKGKRKKIETLMTQYKLKYYRYGSGRKDIDKELEKIPARDYTAGQGAMEFRNPRVALARYIKKRYSDRIGLLVVDEIHRAKAGDSDQAVATRQLSNVAQFTLGLTGTLYGGTASSIYPISHQFSPWVKENYPWVRSTPTHWIHDMGAMETVYVDSAYNTKGIYTGNKRHTRSSGKELPSASPNLLRILFPYFIFAGLKDLGNAMPRFVEDPIEVEMSEEQRGVYNAVYSVLEDYLAQCLVKGDRSFTAGYYSTLLRLPDSMFRENEVHHRTVKDPDARRKEFIDKLVMLTPTIGNMLTPKDDKMVELVKESLSNDIRVILFMSQTGTRDIRERVQWVLNESISGVNPFLLNASLKPSSRDEYIQKMIDKGHNVMISNPNLVREGVDLIQFGRTIYLEVDPSLQVMTQSKHRTWRLSQPLPEVDVKYLYYDDKYQNRAVKSVADKNRAANILYGNDESGIAELAQTNEFYSKMSNMAKETINLTQEQMKKLFNTSDYTNIDYINSSWYIENPRKKLDRKVITDIIREDFALDDEEIEEVLETWES